MTDAEFENIVKTSNCERFAHVRGVQEGVYLQNEIVLGFEQGRRFALQDKPINVSDCTMRIIRSAPP